MALLKKYNDYFKSLADASVTLLKDGYAFGFEDLSDIYEGTIRAILPNNGSWLFLLINPIIKPISNGNVLDARLMGGFVLLKNIPLRDISPDEIITVSDSAMNLLSKFNLKMLRDSRAGNVFWAGSYDYIESGKTDIEVLPLLSRQDATFVGSKLIFNVQIPFAECADISDNSEFSV